MATTIVGPQGSGGGGFNPDAIDSAFKSVYGMFGPPATGTNFNTQSGGTGPYGLTPQPISGANDSLTAYFRGLHNLLGTTAGDFLNRGAGVMGAGLGVTNAGLNMAQGGLPMITTGEGGMEQGMQTLQPSIDFYQKLLSGDPATTTAALAPTAANIATITAGATDQASRGMPGGGYRASTLAGLPFAQAGQVGNAALALQPAAAQALGQLGGEQAQIGQAEVGAGTAAGNLGLGIAQTGLGLGEEGLGLTGQAFQGLSNAVAEALQKMGYNIQGGTSSTFSQIMGSL
jgi:hypothetical protein